MAGAPIFVGDRKTAAQDIVNADGAGVANSQELLAVGSSGGRVFSITVTTDDTSNEVIGLWCQRGGSGTKWLLGAVPVALRAGDLQTTPVAAVSLLNPAYLVCLDSDGTLPLGPSDKLFVAPLAAITSAKTTHIFATYGDF